MSQTDTASEPVTAPAEKPATPMGETVELAKTVIYALLVAFIARVILFQPFTIPSASMEPGLKEGDYIIVSKFSYGWSKHSIPFSPPLFNGRIFFHAPQRGDVVVFKFPADMSKDFIKRLIAVPGDKIQVRHGTIILNGQPVPEQQLSSEVSDTAFGEPRQLDRYRLTLGKHQFVTYSADRSTEVENTGVYTVPQGCYFMMGDNRDNSLDSRFASGTSACATPELQPFINAQEPGVGFVPAENLVGKAELILVSWKPGASLFKPWTWLNIRLGRFLHPLS